MEAIINEVLGVRRAKTPVIVAVITSVWLDDPWPEALKNAYVKRSTGDAWKELLENAKKEQIPSTFFDALAARMGWASDKPAAAGTGAVSGAGAPKGDDAPTGATPGKPKALTSGLPKKGQRITSEMWHVYKANDLVSDKSGQKRFYNEAHYLVKMFFSGLSKKVRDEKVREAA